MTSLLRLARLTRLIDALLYCVRVFRSYALILHFHIPEPPSFSVLECVNDLGRSEVLRSLRHYLAAVSQGHHTTDRVEERGVDRGSARRSSLKGRERAIVSQTKVGTLSKGNVGETSERRGWSVYGLFRAHRYRLQLS